MSKNFKGNLGITIRIGADRDEMIVTDKRLPGQEQHFDRAAYKAADRSRGLKPWEGGHAKLTDATVDAWAEDRGFQKAGRADKLAKDQKFKQRRRNRED